jgi:hypothetical protein
MAISYTSNKLRFRAAEQFKESFSEIETPIVGYITIGKHVPFANEAVPELIIDSTYTEKSIWNNMIAGKKLTGNDIELVIPKVDWVTDLKYRQFDDTIEVSELLSANASQNLQPMYVINSEGNVYKCLSNGVNAYSTVEPLGQNLAGSGDILTADGYIWKYMYNVTTTNKFSTNTWIPSPTSTDKLGYSGNANTVVDGELVLIVVDDVGSGYKNNTISVGAFTSSCTVLSVDFSVDIANTLALNMGLSGTGLAGDAYITAIDTVNRKINLAYGTTSSGGGSGNTLNVFTRAIIQGDGTGALCQVSLSNNSVSKLTVTNFGVGYRYANVFIYGTATGANTANARVVLPPKFGHGHNAALEFGAHNVMLAVKIGDVDSTEGNIISSNTSFRQYALLANPYKYNQNVEVTYANANSAISQTTDVSLIAGDVYDDNEFVYQGNISNPTFSGYVNTQTSNLINLNNDRGTAAIGSVLKGTTTNLTGRTIFSFETPEFEPYTGDIFYGENFVAIQRNAGQAENIKFIVKF